MENEDFAIIREIPTTFVVVILTDGFENSSRNYTLEDIRTIITRLEATGNWTFSFIGATLYVVDIAEQMSIKRQNRFHRSRMVTSVLLYPASITWSLAGNCLKKKTSLKFIQI
jgi:hypothetical protein